MKKNRHEPENRAAVSSAPDHVQIQTITGCNAKCIFCPNGKTRRKIPRGRRMGWDLYRSIVDQCIELGRRRYSVYLMNEPMLDRELAERWRDSGRAPSWRITSPVRSVPTPRAMC